MLHHDKSFVESTQARLREPAERQRLVAEATRPAALRGLTARLQGAETMYVQVDAMGAQAAPALQAIPGVTRVAVADHRAGIDGFEVESARGTDIRRDIARAVVNNGWGLLELRPMRMSLEEIFLQVTTEEGAQTSAPLSPEPEPQPSAPPLLG